MVFKYSGKANLLNKNIHYATICTFDQNDDVVVVAANKFIKPSQLEEKTKYEIMGCFLKCHVNDGAEVNNFRSR